MFRIDRTQLYDNELLIGTIIGHFNTAHGSGNPDYYHVLLSVPKVTLEYELKLMKFLYTAKKNPKITLEYV